MSKILFQLTIILLLFSASIFQTMSQTLACKKQAFAALKPIPKLQYKCREEIGDYDEKILKYPERLSAINRYIKSLEKFIYADWWKTDVDDLNVCDFRKKTGVLNAEEKDEFERGDYFFQLYGNNQIRIVAVRDPCYQTGYNGSNIFLLNRKNGKVFVAEIIDGFFTRADFPLGVDFAMNGGEQLIEIATMSGGLYATVTNYYFAIDKRTNKAVPKNLFKDEGELTNRITSMMLLGDSEEYDLPPNLQPLEIFKNNRLTKSFDIFVDTGETFGEDNHRKFERSTLRWNGKIYE